MNKYVNLSVLQGSHSPTIPTVLIFLFSPITKYVKLSAQIFVISALMITNA